MYTDASRLECEPRQGPGMGTGSLLPAGAVPHTLGEEEGHCWAPLVPCYCPETSMSPWRRGKRPACAVLGASLPAAGALVEDGLEAGDTGPPPLA